MLFHVTMRHDAAHCPGYRPELAQAAVANLERLDELAAQFGVTVQGYYNAAPAHREFLVAEAESTGALALFISNAIPYPLEEIDAVAVLDRQALLDLARAESG